MRQNIVILLLIIIFSSGCLTTDVIQGVEFKSKQYINASNITVTGATASGSLQNITDLNQGYYNVSEGNAQPFYVVVNFTNITNFSFLEAKAKYFSVSGTPSSHVVDLEIYCTTDNEYEDLFFMENAGDWRYFTRHFPDSMHFIDMQGNVSIKFNHSANGNVNHRLWIDTVRLITSAQYEQNIITTNQYFNTTGTGGASNLSQLSIDSNKNWMNYSIYNISLNHSNLTNLDFNISGHTGFAEATASKTITVGASGKNYTSIFDAYASIAPVIDGDVTILVDQGTYSTPINMGGKTSKNGFVINVIGNNTTTLVSTTGTGGTTGNVNLQSTVVKTGAGWTVDAYRGKWLVFTSGNNTGIERLIENNTADTLYLVGNFLSNAPANGEGFNIIENNVNITDDIHMFPSGVKHVFRNVNLKEFSGSQVSVEFYNSQLEPGSYINNNFFVSNVIFDRSYIKTQTTGNLYGYYMISIYSEIRNGSYSYGNFTASSSLGWTALVYSGHVLIRDGSLIKNYWAGLWSRLGGSSLLWKGDLTNAASIQLHNNSVALKADQAGFIQVDDAVFYGSTAFDKSPAGKTDPGWIS